MLDHPDERANRILRIELMDAMSIQAMKRIGPLGRLRLMNDLTRSGIILMKTRARDQHPDWTQEQIGKEVARRIRNAAD